MVKAKIVASEKRVNPKITNLSLLVSSRGVFLSQSFKKLTAVGGVQNLFSSIKYLLTK